MFTTDVMANAIYGVVNNTFEDRHSFFATIIEEVLQFFVTSATGNIKSFAVAAVPCLNRIFQIRLFYKLLAILTRFAHVTVKLIDSFVFMFI